jgi:hypothetical protein
MAWCRGGRRPRRGVAIADLFGSCVDDRFDLFVVVVGGGDFGGVVVDVVDDVVVVVDYDVVAAAAADVVAAVVVIVVVVEIVDFAASGSASVDAVLGIEPENEKLHIEAPVYINTYICI